MSSNEELSLFFYKCGMDVWSYKLEDKTYYLHVEDTSCSVCFKHLLNSYNVNRHLKRAHAPNTIKNECDQCDATFTSDGALWHHVRLSHETVFQLRKDSSVLNVIRRLRREMYGVT